MLLSQICDWVTYLAEDDIEIGIRKCFVRLLNKTLKVFVVDLYQITTVTF